MTDSPPPRRNKWLIFLVVAALSLIADQAKKIWARGSLPVVSMRGGACVVPDDIVARTCQGHPVTVISGFWEWRLSMNPGSAFGLLSNQSFARTLFSVIGIAAVFGMLFMVRKARPDQKILHWALALVAGGAVGNLIDRIYYGVVTDFILWHWGTDPAKNAPVGFDKIPDRFSTEWPVFNVADIVLVIGVGLMFIDIQKEGKREKEKKRKRQEKARAAGLIKST